MHVWFRTIVLGAVWFLLSGTDALSAQQGPTCQADEYHQFDFWIGKWEVTDPNGQVTGHNEIKPFAASCALLENWVAASGGEGKSINSYQAGLQQWRQYWVGGGGFTLILTGGLVEGKMVLTGPERVARGGQKIIDRVTWTPVNKDEIRQVWESSPDQGTNWTTVFDGTYRRVK